jgi:hypothetical protein
MIAALWRGTSQRYPSTTAAACAAAIEARRAARAERCAIAGADVRIILNPIDQNPCAHWRKPMDMMRQGCSMSRFQAAQQWSTRSS